MRNETFHILKHQIKNSFVSNISQDPLTKSKLLSISWFEQSDFEPLGPALGEAWDDRFLRSS